MDHSNFIGQPFHFGAFDRQAAPPSHFADVNDGFLPQEPSLVDAPYPQYPTLDSIHGEDTQLYWDSDFLVRCSSKSMQLNSAKFGIESNKHIQQVLMVEIHTDLFGRNISIQEYIILATAFPPRL